MAIKVRCACGKIHNVVDKLAGKKMRCKNCDNILEVKRPLPGGGCRTSSSRLVSESEFADPFERRGLKAAGLDRSSPKANRVYIPSIPILERAVEKMLPLLGVMIGVGMMATTYVLWTQYRIVWPWLGAMGIVVSIVFLNRLTGDDDDEV